VQASRVPYGLLDLRRHPAPRNRLRLALVLRPSGFRLAVADPSDKTQNFLPFSPLKSGSGGRNNFTHPVSINLA
jgi:hypothetical protein